ncbi:MAG TPA: membrane protein insertion efficiency factor YidD [Actinomycetota bacterium]|nr:membrane protein insertion efficiency factor YidD [Actinomycetota bacterium]
MNRLLRGPSLLLIGIIRLYQFTISKALPQRCRFHPSCSEYAVQSLRERGLLRGLPAAAWRVLRCGPWSPGGLDPVRIRHVGETARG